MGKELFTYLDIDFYHDLDQFFSRYSNFINTYIKFVNHVSVTKSDIQNGLLGLSAEVGELANAFKKQYYQDIEITDMEYISELGDIFWYFIYTLNAMDFNFKDVIEYNVNKLRVRYNDRYKSNDKK